MRIETKFNIGDNVFAVKVADYEDFYFVDNRPKIISGTVIQIMTVNKLVDGELDTRTSYSLSRLNEVPMQVFSTVEEKLVFKTEDDAKKYIQKHQ